MTILMLGCGKTSGYPIKRFARKNIFHLYLNFSYMQKNEALVDLARPHKYRPIQWPFYDAFLLIR
jgi:hypothetical protein